MITPLNEDQLNSLPQGIDRNARPVRFMCDGKSVNICTGEQVGGNIMNQMVYWDCPISYVNAVLSYLKENNPHKTFKAFFSKE